MKTMRVLFLACIGLLVGLAASLAWQRLQTHIFPMPRVSQSAPSDPIHMKFRQLEKGMTQEKVVDIMGYPNVADEIDGKFDMIYSSKNAVSGMRTKFYIVTLTNEVVWNLTEVY